MAAYSISEFTDPFAVAPALKYLLDDEWEMGNGQCKACCGVGPRFYGEYGKYDARYIGHRSDCPAAAAIKDLGWTPFMARETT